MPNRIIKESICASEEIDALTDQQEVFFYRLMVVADDYGLMDARPAMLKAKCYPLKSIDINCIQAMLAALQTLDLIRMYSVEGKRYLQITNWAKHQQIRAKRAKYPMPDQADDNTCNQLISDAPVIQSNPIQSESKPTAKAAVFSFKTELLNLGVDAGLVADWLKVRKAKKASDTQTAFTKFLNEVKKAGWSIPEAVGYCTEKDWKGFEAEWVKDIKPIETAPAIPFDLAAYEAKRKADADAAKERMRQEQAEFMRAQA